MLGAVLTTIAVVALGVLIPTMLGQVAGQFELKKYLEKNHPSVWQSLGTPSLVWGSWGVNQPFARFILNREYLRVPDPELHRRANELRELQLVAIVAFFLVVIPGPLVFLIKWVVGLI